MLVYSRKFAGEHRCAKVLYRASAYSCGIVYVATLGVVPFGGLILLQIHLLS